MRDYNGYKLIEISKIPESKLCKVIKTGKLSLTKEDLSGSGIKMLVHPLNYKVIKAAKNKGKGCNIELSGGEILADLDFHEKSGSGMEGGSIWSFLKNKAFPWIKKSLWPVVKPLVSDLADQGATMLGNYTGQPGIVKEIRKAVKDVSGVGMMTTQQKRLANLEKARAAKYNKRKGSGLYL